MMRIISEDLLIVATDLRVRSAQFNRQVKVSIQLRGEKRTVLTGRRSYRYSLGVRSAQFKQAGETIDTEAVAS